MINNLLKKNYHILICFFLILSIYFGFFLGENITLGPKLDFKHALAGANHFEKDFIPYEIGFISNSKKKLNLINKIKYISSNMRSFID